MAFRKMAIRKMAIRKKARKGSLGSASPAPAQVPRGMVAIPAREVAEIRGRLRRLEALVDRIAGGPSPTPATDAHRQALARATDVLGDRARAESWLRSPNRALGGRVPLELLDDEGGLDQVETILGRIEYGVYS